jgi:hypothetical protein
VGLQGIVMAWGVGGSGIASQLLEMGHNCRIGVLW